MKHLIITIVALAMFGLTSTEAQAQWDCGECEERWHEVLKYPYKEHKIPASEAASWSCGNDGFETLTFASGVGFTALGEGNGGCHGSFADGSCIAAPHNHGACEEGGSFTARMAQVEGDETATYALLATTSLTVTRSRDEPGVSVMDCDGVTPIATITLSDAEVERLLDGSYPSERRSSPM